MEVLAVHRKSKKHAAQVEELSKRRKLKEIKSANNSSQSQTFLTPKSNFQFHSTQREAISISNLAPLQSTQFNSRDKYTGNIAKDTSLESFQNERTECGTVSDCLLDNNKGVSNTIESESIPPVYYDSYHQYYYCTDQQSTNENYYGYPLPIGQEEKQENENPITESIDVTASLKTEKQPSL